MIEMTDEMTEVEIITEKEIETITEEVEVNLLEVNLVLPMQKKECHLKIANLDQDLDHCLNLIKVEVHPKIIKTKIKKVKIVIKNEIEIHTQFYLLIILNFYLLFFM